MAIFPNELLSEVCSHADIRTLKQLRLVDRTMDILAGKFLFEELEVILLPKSIENARKIMGHPVFCLYVRSLIYFGQRLNDMYTHIYFWNLATVDDSHNGSQADINHGWLQFCTMFSEQSSLIEQHVEVEFFSQALKALPNLKAIENVDFDWSESSGDETTSHYTRIAESCQLPVFRAFKMSHMATRSDLEHSPHVSILKALFSYNNNQVQRLNLSDVPWFTSRDLHTFAFYHAVEAYAEVFMNLRSLTFAFSVHLGRMPSIDHKSNKLSLLGALLRHTLHLEELVLLPCQLLDSRARTAVGHLSEQDVHTEFTDIFAHLTWPHLRELELENCVINTRIFINFIEDHKSTLDSLRLCNVKLSDLSYDDDDPIPARRSMQDVPSAWEWAARRLAPVLDLSECYLEELTDDELAKRIGEGDKNGISVEWLVRSWRMELSVYFEDWEPSLCWRPYLPVYGEPRVIGFCDEDHYNAGDY